MSTQPERTSPTTSNHPIVIAGGGVAALEAVLSLRAETNDRPPIELICPNDQFDYPPLSVLEPFTTVSPCTVNLASFAAEQGVRLRRDRVASVDLTEHAVTTDTGAVVSYRALLMALGAQTSPGLRGAVHFAGHADALALRGVLDHIVWGEARTLAFVIPDGCVRALPLYELALLSRARFDEHGAKEANVMVITAEQNPLEMFGEDASDTLGMLLAVSRIELRPEVHALAVEDRVLTLDDGSHIDVDHVFVAPRIEGTRIPGLPHDDDGFVRIDAHCRVKGLDDVYAAGDMTSGFAKLGGLAAQQANAAAEAILADLGYPITPTPFEPVLAGVLLTGDLLSSLESHLDDGRELPWQPPSKIVARHLGLYLGTRAPDSRDADKWQHEHRLPVEIELGPRAVGTPR